MPPSASVRRVQEALAARGFALQIREFAQPTRTAAEAAAALGCRVEQIVKSLVFRAVASDRIVLVVTSGGNRVDEAKVAALMGEPIVKADAAFVRTRTGFAIGGVPPVGHSENPHTLIDRDLMQWEEIWAAAGTPHAVVRLTPGDLRAMTDGHVAQIARGEPGLR